MTDVADAFDPEHRQGAYTIRFETGPTGAAAIVEGCDVAVVVDVLSFTTTLCVALARGITVYPYPWKDEGAAAYAEERDAVLAVGRLEARSWRRGVSLSPSSIAAAYPVLEPGGEGARVETERLVLPSPNGSSISFQLAGSGATVVGASLLNATAVATWIPDGARVSVVAAGERWPDGSLRPAVEDLWGAGAVLSAMTSTGRFVDISPEALVAVEAFRSVRSTLKESLLDCASGRELVERGFASDVWTAAVLDGTDVVPVLDGDAFVHGD